MENKWVDGTSEVRTGEELDTGKLEKYLKDALEGLDGKLEIEQFPRGFSNLTYLLRFGDKEFVMRRPPFGAQVKSGHDMGREYKILHALSASYSKAPKPYVYCEDTSVIGAPFYVMDRVKGVILRAKMPEAMILEKTVMRGISESLISTFVELHAVDYKKVGLEDLGKPEGYIRRQVEGWTRRYFKAKTDDIETIEKAAHWLAEHQPSEVQPSLIHNDFKYDNVVLDPEDWTRVMAVLDWEMCTIGDPLMDLGTSLGYWVNEHDPDWWKSVALSPTTIPGNPTREEVVEMYSTMSGRDVGDIIFYYVYGVFKIAVIAQQIYYRYKHGYTQDQRFAKLIGAVNGLGLVAQQAIERKRLDNLF